ncbi:MAG: hypothetical protein LBJ12_02635 [Oscillospiraceae bacterium]|jgi:hypothetical protein|nr:hypothetical protein [Oscillospiraceae bacterium]
MKRMFRTILSFAAAAVFVFAITQGVFAMENNVKDSRDSEFAMNQLLLDWEENGYPDDIGGQFRDIESGKLGLLVINPSTARVDELHEKLGANLLIVPTKYAYNDLMRVKVEIEKIMQKADNKIYGVSVGWGNEGETVFGFGESGKEFRVIVLVDKEVVALLTAQLKEKYGEKVIVEESLPIEAFENNALTAPQNSNISKDMFILLIVLCIFLLSAITLFAYQKNKRVPLLQTFLGITVERERTSPRAFVVRAVKNRQFSPKSNLFSLIRDKIEKGFY